MTDIVDRLRTVDISWSQEGEWCAEAADEIITLRKDNKLAFELMDTFVKEINRLKQVLYSIASIEIDPDFGTLPISEAQKIAQNALEDD
jgi:hypothetical protein